MREVIFQKTCELKVISCEACEFSVKFRYFHNCSLSHQIFFLKKTMWFLHSNMSHFSREPWIQVRALNRPAQAMGLARGRKSFSACLLFARRRRVERKSRAPRAVRRLPLSSRSLTVRAMPYDPGAQRTDALFPWLISHQPAVLFSQNKPATSNQPAVLFPQNKPAPAISHQPTEQAVTLRATRPATPTTASAACRQGLRAKAFAYMSSNLQSSIICINSSLNLWLHRAE
jgi:hypothetical protein